MREIERARRGGWALFYSPRRCMDVVDGKWDSNAWFGFKWGGFDWDLLWDGGLDGQRIPGCMLKSMPSNEQRDSTVPLGGKTTESFTEFNLTQGTAPATRLG